MLAEISDFICFKIKVVFTPSSYNFSASCIIFYNPKFKVDDHVKLAKCKSIFLKDIVQIGQKKFLLLIKLKMQFLGHTQLMT